MKILLSDLLSYITTPGLIFLKKKKEIVEAKSINLQNLNLYKDYVVVPFIKETVIYDAFLDYYHLDKIKEKMHCSKDFETEFRRFINYNPKYGHLLNDHYIDFKKNYLKSIVVLWCKNNKIEYIDDIGKIII